MTATKDLQQLQLSASVRSSIVDSVCKHCHVAFEEPRVHGECHRSEGMAEHVLNLLDVGPGGYGHARRRIPKVVGSEVRKPGGPGRGIEDMENLRRQFRSFEDLATEPSVVDTGSPGWFGKLRRLDVALHERITPLSLA